MDDILLTKEDIESSKWEEILSDCKEKDCAHYNSVFVNAAKESKEKGEVPRERVFNLLGAVTQFHFKPESTTEPFGPLFVFNESRGLIPADFGKNSIESLKLFVENTSDNELIARIADVLWLQTKDYKLARKAVDAYMESSKILEDPSSWPPSAERTERALRIAATLRDKPLFEKVIGHIESVLKKYNGTDPLFFSARLMELLLEFKKGEPGCYIEITKRMADEALEKHDWHKSRTYFDIEAQWHVLAGNEEEGKKAKENEAKVYVKEAELIETAEKPSYLIASAHIQKAIEALRKIGGQQQIIDELHKKLLAYEKNIKNEMQEISHNIDLSEIAKDSENKVKEKSFIDAIQTLSLMYASPKVAVLEKSVKDKMKKFPISFLFSRFTVNAEGKVIARNPGMTAGGSEDENKDVIRTEMYSEAVNINMPIATQGIIEPARRQITLEHNGTQADFMQFTRNNPFVPEGREKLFARALSAGLQGDFVVFLGIAAPQIENSIRYMMSQHSIPTSHLDQYGIQKEMDLNELLFRDDVKKILGEDLVFDLQALLIIPVGANLRNRYAHGLMEGDEQYSIYVSYFWWLLLRIVVLCLRIMEKQHSQTQKTD